MASVYGISIKLSADLRGFSKELQNAERDLKRFGANMQNIGRSLSTALTLPIVGLGAAAVNEFTNFETQMAKVKAVSGATGQDFENLSQLARDLGKSTKYSAGEVAGLELEFSKLGFVPAQIQAMTGATLELATVADTELSTAATVAGATMRGFGIEAENASRVVDVMALSFSSSALDMEKFSTAMAIVAPVAKSAGLSLEQTTAQLSVLVNRGIDASTAGTALRNILLKLSEHGITWSQAVRKITTATDSNAAALELFGTRGATVAQILAETGGEIESLTDKYNGAAGSASEMAAVMNDTLKNTFLELKSAVSELGIATGETLKPVIEATAKSLNKLVDWLNGMSQGGKTATVVIAAVAAAIGPMIYLVGSASKGLALMVGHFRQIRIAALTAASGVNVAKIAMASLPIIGIVAGLVAVATSVYGAATAYDEAGDSASGFNTEIEQTRRLYAELSGDFVDSRAEIIGSAANIEEFSEKLKDLDLSQVKNLRDLLSQDLEEATRDLTNANDELSQSVAQAKFDKLTEQLAAVNAEIDKTKNTFEGTGGAVRELAKELPKMIAGFSDIKALEIPGLKTPTQRINQEVSREIKGGDQKTSWATMIQEEAGIMREYAGAVEMVKIQYTELGKVGNIFADMASNVQSAINQLIDIGIDPASEQIQKLIQEFRKLELQGQIFETLSGAIVNMGAALVDAAINGGDAMEALKVIIIGVVKQIVTAMLAQAISNAIAKGMQSGGNPIIGLALAAVGVAGVFALFSKVPKLAKGGLAFGPTYAMIGDNPNAATDPEVVAPLSKLKTMLQGVGSGYNNGYVEFEIKGEKLHGVLRNYTKKLGGVS